ncbi:hypothetical protein D8B26_004181 [Coccidioides posadasii str. Silveira]|uniref:Uncharacterized protein n=2 Tax=Coccidioides posadasii TaxID=199306 RepID=E9DJ85_COCPS|nr:hypothetical protein CPSG_09884 [Coccidioides posadasii str. Silveira]KMM69366.1 hypothetical protein CPAG_05682 [Coccidioides posadasii RMSCC 3488]QVM09523.1 hypothetical protein D8B26_004181 [Coccidioides posadasii str. Silveira]
MRLRSFLLSIALIDGILAGSWVKVEPFHTKALRARRGQKDGSFTPGTSPGTGGSCGDAFGAGFTECATSGVCYSPDEGDTCCSEGYPCPAGSFCLAAGKCCPDGLSPEECAAKLSVTLSLTKQPQPSQQPPATNTPPPPANPSSAKPPVVTTHVCPSGPHPPYPTGSPNATIPGSGNPNRPSDLPEFTGAASPQNGVQGAVAVVALLGFVRNFL